jgi:hypothetical protein
MAASRPRPAFQLTTNVPGQQTCRVGRVGRLNDILKTQLEEAWLRIDRGGRLPGGGSRHVPRGNKIPR